MPLSGPKQVCVCVVLWFVWVFCLRVHEIYIRPSLIVPDLQTWAEAQEQVLTGNAAINDQFGYSVAISGTTLAIGEIGFDIGGSSNGGAKRNIQTISALNG